MTCLNKVVFDTAYAWLAENATKIHISVYGDHVVKNHVMRQYVREVTGMVNTEVIVLNISPGACVIDSRDDGLFFEGRFGGQHASELISWEKVWMIYDPSDSFRGVNLPQQVITDKSHEPKAPTATLPAVNKVSPFRVIDGGK